MNTTTVPSSGNREIANRLRKWVDDTFPSVAEFARKTNKPAQFWYQYFNASRRPGNDVQGRLREVGAPVEFIMTGKSAGEQKKTKKTEAVVAFHAPGHMSEDQRKAIQKMVDDLADLPPGEVDRAREIVRMAFKRK